ncbi:MAG: RsmB/NOP family class I SAM-dependent RNA methyltransferase [Deltaproteobacteria bacterium]|nr:RsmB/NOP family class I SAM-dependent RNA methyltransferase [Deltaproteobacteria bacterium]
MSHGIPQEFIDRIEAIIPIYYKTRFWNLLSKEKETTFRVNPLRTTPQKVLETLERDRFRLKRVDWYPGAFILMKGRQKDLEKTGLYQNGQIYIQNLSSMVPPLVLDPKPGERVLDIAAAPGSKTTQMAGLMRGSGKIVAIDSDRIRCERLRANVERLGALNVEVLRDFGERYGKRNPESFDRILVDAPCSSEGQFCLKNPGTFLYWKLSRVYEAVKMQKKLLTAAFTALKKGGTLVYSTCTFAPEENEGVLDWLLSQHGSDVRILPIELPFSNQTAPLSQWDGKIFHPAVSRAKRILPTETMEGFFLAKIVKQ